jgi:hypothetical protein
VTLIIIRIVVIALVFGAIAFGSDLKERDRPDVITLQRDKDGTFRPPDNDDKR